MFTITNGKGFHVKFYNGIILSTQFGVGNLCENRYGKDRDFRHESRTAAVCIWKDGVDGYLIRKCVHDVFNIETEDDEVGYCSVADWAKIVDWCNRQT